MAGDKKSKRQARREQAQKKENQKRLITILLIVLGAAFVLYAVLAPTLRPVAEVTTVETHERYLADDNSMGDPNAPIQLTEFSDFQCPYCKRHYTQTEPLLEQYYVNTNLVHATYRSAGNFISQGGGTESQDAAMAAYCAGDQNKFWQMHDALFANNRDVENRGSFSVQRLKAIAGTVEGLDLNAFNACLDSGKYKTRTQDDATEGTKNGMQGTPYFVITYTVDGETKTKTLDGAQPFSEFQVTLEAILNELGLK
ncbi:MAG: hypothetical protein HKUEN02_15600 [Anaerolineaceae bacterium]|nr:MAG: hypothetical protein HKUEN02_15600 [Anaerolineaceae bacterium]